MSAATFIPDPGTNFAVGQEPTLALRTAALARALGINIYGISGYRTPAHSVAVGGSATDPHTQAIAEDVGVGSQLRSSAAQVSEAELAKFGLYRPFDPTDDPNNTEVNHWQLLPTAAATSTPAPASSPSSSPGSGGILGSGVGPNVGPDLNPVDAIKSLFLNFLQFAEASALKASLYAVLILGGIALAVYGLVHAVGRRLPAPSIPPVPIPE